jgi:hypothetical protein
VRLKGHCDSICCCNPHFRFDDDNLSKCGDISGRLFLGTRSNLNIRERLSGDNSRARVQKMNGNYEETLRIIENVLAQAPDFNEALFIKAQILLDGFRDTIGAKKCISMILNTESNSSGLYRRARNIKFKLWSC